MTRVRKIRHSAVYTVAPNQPRVPPKNHILVYTGEVAVGTNSVVLEALLGSCVAVCLHDPLALIGGMTTFYCPERTWALAVLGMAYMQWNC